MDGCIHDLYPHCQDLPDSHKVNYQFNSERSVVKVLSRLFYLDIWCILVSKAVRVSMYLTATGFILQHRFFANFTCLSSLLRYFKPLKNINIGRRH